MFIIFRGECVTAVMGTHIIAGRGDSRALGKPTPNGEESRNKDRGTTPKMRDHPEGGTNDSGDEHLPGVGWTSDHGTTRQSMRLT